MLVVLVIGAGAGAAAGIWMGLADVRATRDAFYQEYALADLELILTAPVPESTLPAAPAVGLREGRLLLDGTVSDAGLPAHVVGMAPDATLDRLALSSGSPLSAEAPTGAVLDPDTAATLGLEPGDAIALTVAGRRLRFRVVGTGRTPDALLATADPAYLLPQRGSLAIVYVPLDGLQAALGVGPVVDDVLLTPAPGATRGDVLAAASTLPVAAAVPAEEQYGRRFVEADVQSFAVMVPVLGTVFALVAVALILLELRRLVATQRRELGALLALGHSTATVVGTVLRPALVLGTAGALLGMAGTRVVGRLVAEEYAAAVGFPHVSTAAAPAPLLGAVALGLGATLVGAAIPATRLARLRPAAAMHGPGTEASTPPAWSLHLGDRLRPERAYALRGLLLRPVATAVTIAGLGLAVGLAVALAILVDSAATTIDTTFAGQRWSHQVTLTSPLPVTEALQLVTTAGAEEAEPFLSGPVRIAEPGDEAARLVAYSTDTADLRPLHLVSGSVPGPGEVAIAGQLASTLDAGVGDRISLRGPGGGRELVVAGILRTLAGRDVVATPSDAAGLLGVDGATGVLVRARDPALRRLAADGRVARIAAKATLRDGVHEFIAELTGVLGILLAVSLGVGLVALATHLAVAALDRRDEFATLRALGYGRRHIAGIVVTEALTVTLPALVAAVPAGRLLVRPLADAFSGAAFTVTVTPRPVDHLAIAAALPLAVLVAAVVGRRIAADDLAAAFRARAIG